MTNFESIQETVKYVIIILVTFAVLQSVVIVMHEFTQ
jgi:hypothetical protein